MALFFHPSPSRIAAAAEPDPMLDLPLADIPTSSPKKPASSVQPPAASGASTEPQPGAELALAKAPKLLGSKVVRRGKWSRIMVRWMPVLGATSYHLQMSRTLNFDLPEVNVQLEQTRFIGNVKPGAYFCRIRAIGPAGTSEFSLIKVIDASRTTAFKPPSNVGETEGSGKVGADGPGSDVAMRRAPASTPADPDLVELGGGALVVPGADELAEAAVLGPVRSRLEQLVTELDGLNDLYAELVTMAAKLEGSVSDPLNARRLADLKLELQRVQLLRDEILRAVETNISEINERVGGL